MEDAVTRLEQNGHRRIAPTVRSAQATHKVCPQSRKHASTGASMQIWHTLSALLVSEDWSSPEESSCDDQDGVSAGVVEEDARWLGWWHLPQRA